MHNALLSINILDPFLTAISVAFGDIVSTASSNSTEEASSSSS